MARATVSLRAGAAGDGSVHQRVAARATWKGFLKVGEVAAGVKAFPAVVSEDEPELNQLHGGCGERIQYRKWCPVHGAVEQSAIVKGYRCGPEEYVELDEEELTTLRPGIDRELVLECFVDPEQLDPALYGGKTYHLVADGPINQRPIALVTSALTRKKVAGLGRLTMLGRRHLVLVRPREGGLAMYLLVHPERIRVVAVDTSGTPITAAELRSLEQRIGGATPKCVRWSDYRDDSADRLATLVRNKIDAKSQANRNGKVKSRKRSPRKAA